MSSKIACPYCSHDISLKAIRAGRFKLTCTDCKSQFALVVDESTPPKISARQLADEASPPKATQIPPATGKSAKQSTQTTASSSGTDHGSREGDKSQNSASLEQTILSDSVSSPDLGATIIGGGGTPHADSADFSVDSSASSTKTRPLAKSDATSAARLNAQTTTGGTKFDAKPQPAAAVPERLGGYRVLSELGRGGMGSVYLARQLTLNRKVALKTIQAASAADPAALLLLSLGLLLHRRSAAFP